jgi:hypothetical protein
VLRPRPAAPRFDDVNRIERRQLEAERITAEKQAMEQRKAELNQFVEAFRTKIGGIIEQVLNSSGQFERDAHKLSVTAQSTAQISSESAEASRQAPSMYGEPRLRPTNYPNRSSKSAVAFRIPTVLLPMRSSRLKQRTTGWRNYRSPAIGLETW